MEKLLQETFVDLSLTARQQKLFDAVYVERVLVVRETKTVSVQLVCDHVIPYREVALLQFALQQQFEQAGFSVVVKERFRLSNQYNPENFWEEYKDSILLILKEDNVLEFNMFYSGECRVEGNTLFLCCDDDDLFRARETAVKEKVTKLFADKAGMDISIEITYREPVEKEEVPITYHAVLAQEDREKQASSALAVKQENDIAAAASEDFYADEALVTEAYATQIPDDFHGSAQLSADVSQMQTQVPQAKAASGKKSAESSQGKAKAKKEETSDKPKGRRKYEGGYGNRKKSWGASVDEDCFYGRNCDGEMIKLADIQEGSGEVVVEGMITSTE